MNKRKRLAYWRNFHRVALSAENTYTSKLQRELLLQLRAVAVSLRTVGVQATLDNLNVLIQPDGLRNVLIHMWYMLFPHSASRVTTYLRREYAAELERQKFFDTPNQYWLQIINDYILTSVPGQVSLIDDFTKEWIRKKIQQGLEQQMSIDEIVQLLIERDISASRARVIARTNVTGILNAAGQAAAKETRILLRKIWISAQDNRTRRIPRDKFDHLHMDGVAVNMTEKFNVNGDLLDFPGDPRGQAANIIQCRCASAFEPVRDSSGRIIRNEFTTVIPPRSRGAAQQGVFTI